MCYFAFIATKEDYQHVYCFVQIGYAANSSIPSNDALKFIHYKYGIILGENRFMILVPVVPNCPQVSWPSHRLSRRSRPRRRYLKCCC